MEKKYLAVYQATKEMIISGEYKAHEKLPSKRVAADRFGVSVITMETAYRMLEEEGYIESRERSGYYVCAPEGFLQGSKKPHSPLRYLETPEIHGQGQAMHRAWFQTVRKVMAQYEEALFEKAPGKGCPVLRNAIADYLLRYRGMLAQPEQIIIGSGAEQLYEIVVKLLGRDCVYGIENPSYPQIEAVYRQEGAAICKLTMGREGIESGELEKPFQVLHVTPFRSYPTDVTTSISKRIEYLNWAGEQHYIVEDDFNSEFFMPGNPIETLYALDGHNRVIYLNTFSKSISPAMRMGYMILPPQLRKRYDEIMQPFSCSVPVLEQYVLAEFLESGHFERHLNRMRRKMKRESK